MGCCCCSGRSVELLYLALVENVESGCGGIFGSVRDGGSLGLNNGAREEALSLSLRSMPLSVSPFNVPSAEERLSRRLSCGRFPRGYGSRGPSDRGSSAPATRLKRLTSQPHLAPSKHQILSSSVSSTCSEHPSLAVNPSRTLSLIPSPTPFSHRNPDPLAAEVSVGGGGSGESASPCASQICR